MSLPLVARLYILLVILLTIAVLVPSFFWLADQPSDWLVVFLVAVFVALLDLIPIKVYGGFVEMTTSNMMKFAAVLLFPPNVAISAIFLGTLAGEAPAKRIWFKKLFNISALTLTWTVVAFFYWIMQDNSVNLLGSAQNIFALSLAGLADFGVNSVLISLVVSFANRLPFRYVWSQTFGRVILHDLSMIPLGAFLAILWRFNPLSIPLATLPLLIVRHAYQVANQLQRQTHEALVALMRVIDERDQHTGDHSERVSHYARITAEALRLDQEDIEIVAQAALLHDLGKVGMANDILFGSKILNDHERKSAEKHAIVGAELLSKFPLFERGADYVRHHHERFDGTGYPEKLRGANIPLGARIISVADAYQAMTEDRPYRCALPQEIALARLEEATGTQFDPTVVAAFKQVVPRAAAPAPASAPLPAPA